MIAPFQSKCATESAQQTVKSLRKLYVTEIITKSKWSELKTAEECNQFYTNTVPKKEKKSPTKQRVSIIYSAVKSI